MNGPRWNFFLKMPSHGRYGKEIRRYLALLLIPVLLVALLYINVNHVVAQQTEEYAQLMSNHFYVQSASMLHEMQLVGSSILQDSEVDRLLDAETVDALSTLHICDIIKNYLRESPYVQQAYLICNKSGKIYTGDGLYSGESLPAMLDKIGADLLDLTDISSESASHVLNKNGRAPFCVFQIRDDDGSSRGLLIVCLQMTEFLQIFYGLDAELCAIFNDDMYISSYIQGINMTNVDWRSEGSIGAMLGKPVVCEYLEQEDYTYLVAVSRESYERPLHVIIKWFFIYMGAVVVLGYLYLYQAARKRYHHICHMAAALPSSYVGDQSFEHIYENIRKSLEDYNTLLENQQVENQEHILHMLLSSAAGRSATAKQYQKAGVESGYPFYYVASFFTTEILEPSGEKDRHGTMGFFHMLLRSTIRELANQYQVSCTFCRFPKTGCAVLYGNDAEQLREAVQNLCRSVVEILTNSYTMHLQAAISTPVTSVSQLPDAYQETYRLYSFATSINSSASTISGEDLQHGSGALLNGDFIRQEQILINTILVRKYDAVPSMVESILAAHVSSLRKNYTLARQRITSISNVLVEGLRMVCSSDASMSESIQAIEQADSVRQLVSATNQVYSQIAQRPQETVSEEDIITTACEYIRQNLSDPNLNVAAICEAADVSPQRLTRMFQSRFDMAVAEYMNASRIKLAKELLPDRQLTVVQIAQQVGYRNADTFTRNFRKVEGITASEYRKALLGE